ncbi:zinc-binding dehydrogenase [Gordonia sp. HNM0687]|uniref:Zinc-binding dehydrogenase n=1 Tax=Gordonia mangrovi TaxID=2665643 RepID=A0A6L7GMN9_9ACTN|nr:NADP-dependent oxidoreductase [Gordonia mangrovi]MXP20657.1 zinc-binding dehydrogenase [Gordonia mangrovi]UVF80575.1 NADP-dependent oxidoreductase [Gordonia mangrovi]
MAHRIVVTGYGPPADVLALVETEPPIPGPGHVIVETKAIGVNPADAKTVRGQMGADESKLPLPIGFEAAGVISAVGDGAAVPGGALGVGDRVIVYRAHGAYTDRLEADLTTVHPIPDDLDFEHAAGLLLVGVTAADTVRTADVGDDDVVLIHGGSGAVGVIAIQLARAAGATVIATAGPRNHDHLRSLGAIPVAYGDGLLDRVREAAPRPVTSVIDTTGTDEAIDTSLELVDNPGTIVSIAAFGRASDGIVLLNGSTPESRRHRTEAVDGLIADAATGDLVTEVAKTFPLADAAIALTELETSHPRGKFVLVP